MRFIRRTSILLTAALMASVAFGQADGRPDGAVRATSDGSFEAWDGGRLEWLSPESFWLRYAERRGGLTWGRRTEYPPYADVSELDTLIIELDSGPCLMEFFHTRWRRANDVRRWDDRFNEFGGCPYVFD